MKKILIVNNNLHIGGVQRALVNLLWSAGEQYDITLLLFADVGACRKELPPNIKVITLKSGYRYLGLAGSDVKSKKEKLARAFYAGISRVIGRSFAVKLMGLGQKKLTGFDVAISYLHNGGDRVFYGGCNDFVLRHVEAKQKVTFLHCDFRLCGANTPKNRRQYGRFDAVAACSQGCADSFLAACPELQEKTKVVYNCHNFSNIRAMAEAEPQALSQQLNLVTVARLGKEKGVERAIEALWCLGGLRKQLHYYIVGDGIQRPLLEAKIQKYEMQDVVTLCGAKDNPYGYIKSADLLWIPSYSEAAPLVIHEAASLGVPVLSTCTSSAREMIEETGFGWVCENHISGMTQKLRQLQQDTSLIAEKKAFLEQQSFQNTQALQQFAAVIE